jgi:hypothetical protein
MRSPKTAMSQPRSPGRRLLVPPPRGGHVLVVCRGGRIGVGSISPLRVGLVPSATEIDRGRTAIRAVRHGYASPSFWALTGGPPGQDPPPWSPSQAVLTDRRPEPSHYPRVLQERAAESRLCGAWHRTPAAGRTSLLRSPPHAAIGRRERARALSSALMPGRPARRRRSQTSTGPTLLRSQPKTRHPTSPRSGRLRCVGVEPCVRFRRTSSNGGELAPVSSTDSTARRGRR